MRIFEEILRFYRAVNSPANTISDNVAVPEIFVEPSIIAEKKARSTDSGKGEDMRVSRTIITSLSETLRLRVNLRIPYPSGVADG